MKITIKIAAIFFFLHLQAFSQQQTTIHRGAGQLEYTGYIPLKDHSVTVFYYIPTKGDITKMKVLFSMHGAERNGLIQRGVWRNLAEENRFIVIAPQFTHANGYIERAYQFGWVSDDSKVFKERSEKLWTYKIIESLFDYFKKETGSEAKTYDMFGHSAGGQFVHRYLLMTPEARVGKAVAANPGGYTYPDSKGLYSSAGKLAEPSGWPFSFKDTPFETKQRLSAYFKRNMIILIGQNDTAKVYIDKNPDTNPYLIQGVNRYDRAHKYFDFCRAKAKENGMEFNWRIIDVPNAGHSSAQMIYGSPSARNWQIENNEKVFNPKDVTDKGAFEYLIRHKN